MLIRRTNLEDLTILRLLVDKLEEQLVESGIDFFNYDVSHEEIELISMDPEWGPSRDREDVEHESRVKPIKRVTVKFHSKGDFADRYSFDDKHIVDDGIYTAASLNITWDYLTNCFSIRVGTTTYEKELNTQNILRRISKMDNTAANITFDFGGENRREIKLIKIRLGKLYSKLVVDKKSKEERYFRKELTDVALSAFPDLIDSLILGGAVDEKGDD